MSFLPPAGYPLSTYTPPRVGALPPPPPVLTRAFDPATGDVASLTVGADPTDAALQWQFTIRQGSGVALGSNGNRLHLITKATDQAPQQLRDEARRIVEAFEDRGDVSNVTIEAGTPGGATAIRAVQVAYRNSYTSANARAVGRGV